MEQKEEIPTGAGYHYNHLVTGVPMVEYHVDTHESIQKVMENETWLGGQRSVRYPSRKLLVILGHDKMIIKQYLLTKKGWTGPFGKVELFPKDDGIGLMSSALQSWEFGFRLELMQEKINKVNEYHFGKKYKVKGQQLKNREVDSKGHST